MVGSLRNCADPLNPPPLSRPLPPFRSERHFRGESVECLGSDGLTLPCGRVSRARTGVSEIPHPAAWCPCCRKREVVDSLKSRSQGCDDPFSQRGSRRFESAHLHCCQMGEKDRRGKAGQRPGSERQPARQQGQRPGGRRDKRAAGGATGERDGRAAGRRHRRAHARNARTAGREGQATAGSAGGHSAKGRKLRGRHTGAHVRPRGGGTSGW